MEKAMKEKLLKGVMNVKKYKEYAVRGIQIHIFREKKSQTNPDIDPNMTVNNYGYVKSYNFSDYIKDRTSDVKRKIRSDAVRMVDIVFTATHEFFENLDEKKEKEFFADCFEFCAKYFGKINIIAAVVHKDEYTPHIHICIVPINDDGNLSASSYFDGREKMREWQKKAYEEVFEKWGLSPYNRAEKPVKRIETAEWKINNANKKIEEVNNVILQKEEYINVLEGRIEELLNEYDEMNIERLKEKEELEKKHREEKERLEKEYREKNEELAKEYCKNEELLKKIMLKYDVEAEKYNKLADYNDNYRKLLGKVMLNIRRYKRIGRAQRKYVLRNRGIRISYKNKLKESIEAAKQKAEMMDGLNEKAGSLMMQYIRIIEESKIKDGKLDVEKKQEQQEEDYSYLRM